MEVQFAIIWPKLHDSNDILDSSPFQHPPCHMLENVQLWKLVLRKGSSGCGNILMEFFSINHPPFTLSTTKFINDVILLPLAQLYMGALNGGRSIKSLQKLRSKYSLELICHFSWEYSISMVKKKILINNFDEIHQYSQMKMKWIDRDIN